MPPKTKPLAPGRTENQVTSQIVEAAALYGLVLERQNTGGMTNAAGRYVPFGQPGNADWTATVPAGPNRGRRLEVEVKREGFRPEKLRGGRRERRRFEMQRARHIQINERGGIAFWVDNAGDFLRALDRIFTRPGLRVVYDGDYPVMEWD